MAVEELLDENAFDPKKLFDEKEYSTLIVNREGFSNKQNAVADLVEGLLDKKNTRQENEELFAKLKDANAQDMLVDAIKSSKTLSHKALLTAACWESGLDFSAHFLFFTELACDNDFTVAMEALTVIENCEGAISEDTLNKALKTAQAQGSNASLQDDLISNIKQRLGGL